MLSYSLSEPTWWIVASQEIGICWRWFVSFVVWKQERALRLAFVFQTVHGVARGTNPCLFKSKWSTRLDGMRAFGDCGPWGLPLPSPVYRPHAEKEDQGQDAYLWSGDECAFSTCPPGALPGVSPPPATLLCSDGWSWPGKLLWWWTAPLPEQMFQRDLQG